MTSVLIVDDHALLREALRGIISAEGFQVVAEAANGFEAIRQTVATRPDVITMDINLPGLNGIEATREIVKLFPKTRIVICSMYTGHEIECFRAGATSLIMKGNADFVSSLREAINNSEDIVRPTNLIQDRQRDSAGDQPRLSPLASFSTREIKVLKLIAREKQNTEIARLLRLRIRTVYRCRATIKTKLGGKRAPDLVDFARALNLRND